MVKKILSVVVAFLMLFCTIPLSVFADDVLSVCPKCGERTYVQKTGLTVDACGIGVTYNSKHCNSCRYSYYDWVLFGVAGYKEFDSGSGDSLPADFISEWIVKNFGKDVKFSQFQTGGGSASPGGVGRNPSGYAGEGKANVTQSGELVYYVDMYALGTKKYGSNFDGFNSVEDLSEKSIYASSYSGTSYPYENYVPLVYKFTAPVSGLYVVGNVGDTIDFGHCSFFYPYSGTWFNRDVKKAIEKSSDCYSVSLSKGTEEFFCFTYSTGGNTVIDKSFKYSFNSIPIYIQPLGESGITNHNKITINNNTWNGNIYVDNSNKLTYIYPQYTINNETKISNNPIIYNEETKQYYTYDSVTNNYYYITYGDPAPTPTPSPSPDPGGSTPDPGKPTPTPTPGGSGGSGSGSDSSGGGSGFNPFKWLADLLKDIVEGIFKAVWKLITSIFGFLIWLVGLLGNVLPFLPSEGLAALSAAAIIITVIRIIKFILGR